VGIWKELNDNKELADRIGKTWKQVSWSEIQSEAGSTIEEQISSGLWCWTCREKHPCPNGERLKLSSDRHGKNKHGRIHGAHDAQLEQGGKKGSRESLTLATFDKEIDIWSKIDG